MLRLSQELILQYWCQHKKNTPMPSFFNAIILLFPRLCWFLLELTGAVRAREHWAVSTTAEERPLSLKKMKYTWLIYKFAFCIISTFLHWIYTIPGQLHGRRARCNGNAHSLTPDSTVPHTLTKAGSWHMPIAVSLYIANILVWLHLYHTFCLSNILNECVWHDKTFWLVMNAKEMYRVGLHV